MAQLGNTPRFLRFWKSFGLQIDGEVSATGELRVHCPFHGVDRHPSMSANVNTGLWYCFACADEGLSPGGRAKDFVRLWLTQQLQRPPSNAEVERAYAEHMGRVPPPSDEEIAQSVQRLRESPTAQFYLTSRGLPVEQLDGFGLIERFQIGFDGAYLTIPITDEEGGVLYVKRILAGDPDEQRKSLMPDEANAAIWPLPELIRQPEGSTVVLCEGEIDTITAWVQGFVAVTNTAGAGTWKENWNHYFRGRRVVIAYDGDEKGRLGARKVAASLSGVAADIRVVAMPEGQDVNSLWQSGQRLAELIERTSTFLIRGPRLLTGPELWEEAQVEGSRPDLVEGWLEPSTLNLLLGHPKHGKSTLTMWIIRSLLTGEPFLGRNVTKVPVIYMNYELSTKKLAELYKDVLGPPEYWPMTFQDPPRPLNPIRLREWLSEVALQRDLPPGLLVVDPATAAFALSGDRENNAGDVGGLLRTIAAEICHDMGWTVLILHHYRKSGINDPLDAAGSREYIAASDVIFGWQRTDRATLSGRLHVEGRIPDTGDFDIFLSRAEIRLLREVEAETLADLDGGAKSGTKGERLEPLSPKAEKVLTLLQKAGPMGLAMAQLQEGARLTVPELRRALRELEEQGFVRQTEAGRWFTL